MADTLVREPITRFFNFVDQAKREARNRPLESIANLARGMVRSVPQLAAEIPNQMVRTATAGLVNPNFGQYVNQALERTPLRTTNTAAENIGEITGPFPAAVVPRVANMARAAVANRGMTPWNKAAQRAFASQDADVANSMRQLDLDFNAPHPPPAEPTSPFSYPYPAADGSMQMPKSAARKRGTEEHAAWIEDYNRHEPRSPSTGQPYPDPTDAQYYQAPSTKNWQELVPYEGERLAPDFQPGGVNPYMMQKWMDTMERHMVRDPDLVNMSPDVSWVGHRAMQELYRRGEPGAVDPRPIPVPSVETLKKYGNEAVERPDMGGWEGLGLPPKLGKDFATRRANAPPMDYGHLPYEYGQMFHPALHPDLQFTRNRLMYQMDNEALRRKAVFFDAMDRMQGKGGYPGPPRLPPPTGPSGPPQGPPPEIWPPGTSTWRQ